MERGVKHQHLGLVRHDGKAPFDALNMRPGVKRRKIIAFAKGLQHFVIQQDRRSEVRPAVHDPVTDRLDFVH